MISTSGGHNIKVNRHTGGLENALNEAVEAAWVNRHTGGLETVEPTV